MKKLPYIAIIVLFVLLILQNRSCKEPDNTSKIDTVTVYKTIRDTVVVEKPVLIASKPDTIWVDKPENAPDSTYEGLLKQYNQLGNKYFTTNVFKMKFPIDTFGYVTVTDSIYGNWLMNSTLTSDLNIPTRTITIEKPLPKRTEFYVGGSLTLSKSYPVSGIYGGLLMKNKKDRIYGINLGYNGEPQLGLSVYYKIKFK